MGDNKKEKKNGNIFAVFNKEALNAEVRDSLKKELKQSLDGFKQDLRFHPYVSSQERSRFLKLKNKWRYFSFRIGSSVAAIVVLICVVIGFYFISGKNSPTWAQVQERLGTMPFVAAKIYIRDIIKTGYPLNPLVEPKLVEVWAAHGNRMRIRNGRTVTFAEKGQILNTFDLVTRSEADTDSITYFLVNKLGKSDSISLDLILRVENPFSPDEIPEWFPKGFSSKEWSSSRLVDTAPLVVPDPVVSKELAVFDHDLGYAGAKTGKARVWALRKNRLPIRVVVWGRDDFNGQLIRSPMWDMVFTYSREQPKEFFNPHAFAAKLKDPAINIQHLLYMFHQIPGSDSLSDR